MSKITPESCRAARALLGWSQAHLAKAARVSPATVKTYEGRKTTANHATLVVLEQALEAAGVEFIEEDGAGAGARLREPARNS